MFVRYSCVSRHLPRLAEKQPDWNMYSILSFVFVCRFILDRHVQMTYAVQSLLRATEIHLHQQGNIRGRQQCFKHKAVHRLNATSPFTANHRNDIKTCFHQISSEKPYMQPTASKPQSHAHSELPGPRGAVQPWD